MANEDINNNEKKELNKIINRAGDRIVNRSVLLVKLGKKDWWYFLTQICLPDKNTWFQRLFSDKTIIKQTILNNNMCEISTILQISARVII